MALLTWNLGYSVGVKEIDEQHMTWIVLINELYDGIKAGRSKEVLGPILNELVNYTDYHFNFEEKLFDKYDYPEANMHKHQHKDLTAQVMAYKESYENGSTILSIEVITFLKDWLVDHISDSDKRYTFFLNSKGVV